MEPIIALWAIPRSISTAFERIFMERNDFRTFHEPFSVSYYYSHERCSDRYCDAERKDEYSFQKVLGSILDCAVGSPIFFKDMAYHIKPIITEDTLSKFNNTFIIRHPGFALPSLYKMLPDFEMEETGYELQYEVFNLVSKRSQQTPVVIDATDLCENPMGIVAAYCEKLNIPFIKESLRWEPKEIPEWKLWESWHYEAQYSTGVHKVKHNEVTLPEHLQEAYEYCVPFYEKLYKERIRPIAVK